MPSTCCVRKCTNSTRNGFHLFRFPFDRPDILQMWINAIGGNFKPKKHHLICSAHFLATDLMDRPGASGVRLKNLAVPSLFLKAPTPVVTSVQVTPVSANVIIPKIQCGTTSSVKCGVTLIESGTTSLIKPETTSIEFGTTSVPTSTVTVPAIAWKSILKPKENDPTFSASIPSPSIKPASTRTTVDTIKMTMRQPRKIMDSSLIRLKRQENTPQQKQMLRMIKTLRQKIKRKEDKIRSLESLLKYVRTKYKYVCPKAVIYI